MQGDDGSSLLGLDAEERESQQVEHVLLALLPASNTKGEQGRKKAAAADACPHIH